MAFKQTETKIYKLCIILMTTLKIIFFLYCAIFNLSSQELRRQSNESFGLGERLEYDLGYKFLKAGTGYFEIAKETVIIKGRKCYDVNFVVKSLPSLEWLYKVKDTYNTKIDIDGIFPWEYSQKIREGNYKRDIFTEFDQINNKAITKKGEYDTPEYVHDIVSAFFYLRTLDLKKLRKGDIVPLQNFYKDSTYNLDVKVLGRETITVKAGKFKTVVVEPLVKEGGLFKAEGKIIIWLSDDDRKIPVKVGTEIVIGFVGAELTSYKGIRGKLDAKLN